MPLVMILAWVVLNPCAFGAEPLLAPSPQQISAIHSRVQALYQDLHQNPELGFQEQKTAAKLAEQLRGIGFEVTTGVGRTGIVGLLKNGPGPIVMIRAELDALPILEQTGLPFASRAHAKNQAGEDVPVMHACGHDLHMAVGVGTAILLSESKDRWRGTVMFVGEPAEELGGGARAMLQDALFTRFPRPDFAIALHDTSGIPAGKFGVSAGPTTASSDGVEVTFFGRGGHGAAPQATIDPIVMAARTILAWQTIISREIDPRDAAVITVGSIHAGTAGNIIPDEARVQVTVRALREETRPKLLASIERMARAESLASGAEKAPLVQVRRGTGAGFNDPVLAARISSSMERAFGEDRMVAVAPGMVTDDFAEYHNAGVPATMISFGVAPPLEFENARKEGRLLPGTHSPAFAPDPQALDAGIALETATVLELMNRP